LSAEDQQSLKRDQEGCFNSIMEAIVAHEHVVDQLVFCL
jgi:hypothetical protein